MTKSVDWHYIQVAPRLYLHASLLALCEGPGIVRMGWWSEGVPPGKIDKAACRDMC